MGGGVALDHLVGHVHLLAGGVDQGTPPLKRGIEIFARPFNGVVHMIGGEPGAVFQHRSKLGHKAMRTL